MLLLFVAVFAPLAAAEHAASAEPAAVASAHGDVPAGHAEGASHAAHGLPLYAPTVFRLGPLPVTNSMVVTWIVALGLILSARVATRQMQAVPAGAQNFWEWLVESLYGFLESIVGSDLVKRTFWFFATIFIFILFTNWFGLIPGVGTLGWNVQFSDGTTEFRPWLRGANADLNLTFAMAMIFFVMWVVWALQSNGVGGFLAHIFGAKGDTTGILRWLMVVVFFIVGLLEVVSICFRPISLSFRLFGNIYAGENMLEAMASLVQEPAWLKAIASVVIPIPFYFLEVLVGLVQALVFMLLTAVFTLLICAHEDEHEQAAPHG
jgi:F-type H+-transporting ATPase subunit a